jgi:serine/threonine protein phosphatase 1
MHYSPFKYFPKNRTGRDFVVGDLHGMFSELEKLLDEVGFEPGSDRVFSVGDLIDRGPESHRVLEFLDKPWFHAIMGNHEKMLIDAEHDRQMLRSWTQNNGGEWWLSIPEDQQIEMRTRLSQLPIVHEIDTDRGNIGIVHADITTGITWKDFVKGIHEDEDLCNYVLWSRNRFRHYKITGNTDYIDGVYLVVLGHTPTSKPISVSNICYIDTGAAYRTRKGLGTLTLLEIQPELKIHQFNTRKPKSWFF